MLEIEALKKFVPWDKLNLKVIGTANSGFEALSILQNENIDILVTDIKMPIMTGLELFEKAKVFLPNLKVVFISGYDEFEYAKSAIKMNAGGYVLKPIDDNELLQTLKKIIDQLKTEKKQKIMQDNFKKSLPYLKNRIIHQLIEGIADESNLYNFTEELNLDCKESNLNIAVIEIDNIFLDLIRGSDKKIYKKVKRIQKLIIEKIKNEDISEYYEIIYHRIVVLLDDNQDNYYKLNDLIQFIKENTDYTITIGIGSILKDITDIQYSYHKALNRLNNKLFYGKNKLIATDSNNSNINNQRRDLSEVLESLYKAIANYNLEAINEILEEIIGFIQNFDNKDLIDNTIINILFNLDQFLNTFNESLDSILGKEFEELDVLFKFETINEIENWLKKLILKVADYLKAKKEQGDTKLINEIKKYIYNNLEAGLTLKDVADHFSYSPNYLGHIFKENTGRRFSSYITYKRLDKACELLKETDLFVYEIAYKVGYKNITYFSKIFKEHFNLTPSNYRKQSRG
jgi:two-component system response regulator YesN